MCSQAFNIRKESNNELNSLNELSSNHPITNNNIYKNFSIQSQKVSLLTSSSDNLPALNQNQSQNLNYKKSKKCIPSVQKKIDALIAQGKIPISFGNRVVVKYSDEYYKLRKRNEKAVVNSRRKKKDEKCVLERIREVIKIIKRKTKQDDSSHDGLKK